MYDGEPSARHLARALAEPFVYRGLTAGKRLALMVAERLNTKRRIHPDLAAPEQLAVQLLRAPHGRRRLRHWLPEEGMEPRTLVVKQG